MTRTRGDRSTEWTDRYLPGPDGAHVLAVGRDVTERRDAQLKLAASEEKYRALAQREALTGLANRRLRASVRDADIIARVGSDEFVVVRECPPGQAHLHAVRLEQVMPEPIALDGLTIECGASIGSVVAGPDLGASSVLAAAGAAMYAVTHGRRSTARAAGPDV